jgi:hypothetical protein
VYIFFLVKNHGSGIVHEDWWIAYLQGKLVWGLHRVLCIQVAAGVTEVGAHRNDGQRLVYKGAAR